MKIPSSVQDMYDKLYNLCEQYPLKIPFDEVAAFLNMDKEGLRSSIEQGRCQFGICVQKNQHGGNRAFTINTLAFYSWVTNGTSFKVLKLQNIKPKQTRKYKRRTTEAQ